MIITKSELETHCKNLLTRAGTPDKAAALAAETLVNADMRGIHSHGVVRIARYLDCILSGGINPAAEVKVIEDTPCLLRLSAAGGLGIPAACTATEKLIEKAEKMPLAAVCVNHSDHYGAAGYYAMKCAEKGLIGFSMSNTVPLIAVTGAASAAIGNNPFAYAAPAGRYRAILFDVCMSVVASGKIQIASAQGEAIPEGWILDRDGNPTTDADQIFKGAIMLPFAGHKGYGFALMVELLSGVLADAGVLSGVHSWNEVPGRDADTGHFFMAVNPEFFGGLNRFTSRVEAMIDELKSAKKAAGTDKIFYPGEIEFAREAHALENGIDLPDASVEELERADALLK